MIAIVLAAAVIFSPIGFDVLDNFTHHMIQHVTLLMLVGPLLVLGTSDSLRVKLNSNTAFRMITEPWPSFILYAAMMIGVHLSPIHMFIMENPWSHYLLELPLYLIIPYLFYFNLIERNFENRRVSTGMSVVILWLMMVPETLTGFFIYISKSSAYGDMYEINDQRMGGTIMWSGGMAIDAIWILLAVYHWYKSEELKNE